MTNTLTAETSDVVRMRECDSHTCPICERSARGSHADRIHNAAHCCLWKTHDHAARVRIADRVEVGADWHEAIQGEGK